jgi:hypothetical protein
MMSFPESLVLVLVLDLVLAVFARGFIVDPPLSLPSLSTPAGVEREANSHMWPCVLND